MSVVQCLHCSLTFSMSCVNPDDCFTHPPKPARKFVLLGRIRILNVKYIGHCILPRGWTLRKHASRRCTIVQSHCYEVEWLDTQDLDSPKSSTTDLKPVQVSVYITSPCMRPVGGKSESMCMFQQYVSGLGETQPVVIIAGSRPAEISDVARRLLLWCLTVDWVRLRTLAV